MLLEWRPTIRSFSLTVPVICNRHPISSQNVFCRVQVQAGQDILTIVTALSSISTRPFHRLPAQEEHKSVHLIFGFLCVADNTHIRLLL